ncbi:glycoside hydrolase family 2 protein [Deinococcus maricopensis]|uniref:Glycoside hydrolase family 2 sugar binding protein n=1 Tax=Deinococcus maricopensis (strain DSM 21211 / LMG 22137 / NRRL B-23946 / LB-34) TaxID=709986 RepID=E8U9G8_DEIML|nr:glycoside hydrolase family 2 TIM barrel-domain containing protein [Deinococcus maricopensis]ADV67707.1 glycoside hydrolase family 2 sugar binding protein [Deinococcus maricopensis DSM 21211]
MTTYSIHPNPLLERAHWRDLGGAWDFAYDDQAAWAEPDDVTFDRVIQVPFSPETPASGIHDTGFHPVAWYRCRVDLTADEQGRPLLLHFGAVDYHARVWVNGDLVAEHFGGHTPFTAYVTGAARGETSLEIVVRAFDDPHDLTKPRGKQDWQLEPHSIWYPRTTGIWQPVWLECVPTTRIAELRWSSFMDAWEIGVDAHIEGPLRDNMQLRVRLEHEGALIADDRYTLRWPEVTRRIALPDPGIDDFRNELLWSPNHPTLIDATVELLVDGEVVDRVLSYTAIRSVSVQGRRFLLNGRPYYLKMVLDQGYWEQGGLTATDDELRRDVELIRQMGFNGARKHQKVENPRWLYWCDVYGLLVWEEMPSPYRFTTRAVEDLTREWTEVLRRDMSHPSIVAWVPLNESWGVPDLPTNAAHRDYVRTLYHLTRTLDPTRPVIGNDGWEHVATDIVGVHDYSAEPAALVRRYADTEAVNLTFERQRPGDRALTLEGFQVTGQPVVLSEFGGIAFIPGGQPGWGYSEAMDEQSFMDAYEDLMSAVYACEGLSGFCYTQFTDTYQERNGLLFMDRSPKADMFAIARATQGSRTPREMSVDPQMNPYGYSLRWRERLARLEAEDLSSQAPPEPVGRGEDD